MERAREGKGTEVKGKEGKGRRGMKIGGVCIIGFRGDRRSRLHKSARTEPFSSECGFDD